MKVNVLLFARAKDAAGTGRLTVEVPADARVVDLRNALAAECPPLAPLASRLLVAVGNDYAADEARVCDSSEIACFLPVSGG